MGYNSVMDLSSFI